MSEWRNKGVTSLQMFKAPLNSIYVWPNCSLLYPRSLAIKLGRGDLVVKSCNDVFDSENISTWAKHSIVIDHAVYEHCSSRVFCNIKKYKLWKRIE